MTDVPVQAWGLWEPVWCRDGGTYWSAARPEDPTVNWTEARHRHRDRDRDRDILLVEVAEV